jgi:hypothetical protein
VRHVAEGNSFTNHHSQPMFLTASVALLTLRSMAVLPFSCTSETFAWDGVYIRHKTAADSYLAGDTFNKLASATSNGSVCKIS